MTTFIKANINTCRVSELNNQNIIVSKFVEKLLKYRILFKNIPTLLGLYYRDASLMTLYFVILGSSIPKIRSIG